MLIALALWFFAPQEKIDESRVAELVKKLSAEDLNERDGATTELLSMGEPVLALLQKAMAAADTDTKARLEKIIGDVTLPTKWAKELLEAAPDQSFNRLDQAIREKTLDKAQVGRIASAVMTAETSSPEHRQYMLNLIERHRLGNAWPALVQLAGHDHQEGQSAVYYLQRLRPPSEAAPAITKLLPKIKNSNSVLQLLEVLRAMKLEKGVFEGAIDACLDGDDDNIKMNLLSYISSGRFTASLRALLRCWKSSPNMRQNYLREALLRSAPDASVKDLFDMLKGEADDVSLAIDYIARQKVKDGAGPLAEALSRLETTDRNVRPRVLATLRALKIEEQAKAWFAGASPLGRPALLVLVGELDIKSTAPDVLACLEDKDAVVRRAAATALGALKYAEAATALEARLKDDDAAVRRAALQAYAKVKGKAATPVLVATLLGDNADLQAAALDAIPSMDADTILDELTKEANLSKHIARYALALLIVNGGEGTLNRVMVRTAGRLTADDLLSMVKLIQTVRTGR